MSRIVTQDAQGNPNGYVIPIWSILDNPELRPDQIYLTCVAARTRKGPHLHMRRRGVFCCVSGRVRLVWRAEGRYLQAELEPGSPVVIIQPGTPCAIYNPGSGAAKLLNMPTPAWSAKEPDEHPVEQWEDPAWWNRDL